MIDTLKHFATESLFEASSLLLDRLNITFISNTAEPVNVASLYEGTMPNGLVKVLNHIKATYFVGAVSDSSLVSAGEATNYLAKISDIYKQGGHYDGMYIFACDVAESSEITRTDISTLTRALNRISYANPVILIIRQSDHITLSTCERMEYSQEWRRNYGEKLGKVSMLRDINCLNPHRGHLNILESIGEERFADFDGLYNHWKEKFSNELLTKKFYSELSDWYAWAVQIAKFPNKLDTKIDDQKFNHESCIRLITRLIFVWFLKQKNLIPKDFFDEASIRHEFIDNFDPNSTDASTYDTTKSKYYRLILQNLFFAMLNCPIVAEGKTTPNNRRFMSHKTFQGINPDHNINNIMRYELEFKEGGNKIFLELANKYVPFLNGGLFDCLDDKNTGMYYDGFSENQKSLDSLFLPDYLFFGEEVNCIDLSQWYGDSKKRKVSARGIIDILGRYSFTVEENTPLEQEVSLDPELLGKVFENLLAAYNPETQTSARKQTGSFYTPREIVQYMVDESLVAHLKRKCGEEGEPLYRSLVSYSDEDVIIDNDKRHSIVEALYDCRILDPACGSGAFPMGVLQQMVHVLKKVDPTNDLWNKKVVDIATEQTRQEMMKAVGDKEKAKVEEEKKARLADIEEAFNNAINYPDYARKLFLIEHCIHGVDIQPIATQISKLRFFISLVVDQKSNNDPKTNFGIRPLPNLESKFVTANTLIPLDRQKTLFDTMPEVEQYEKELQDLSHRIFLSKRNAEKTRLRQEMDATRISMAMTLNNNGFLGRDGYSQLVNWNMFDQNSSASFFDPEWMFGVKDGFDIVIGNPPYVLIDKKLFEKQYSSSYKYQEGKIDLYRLFIEKAFYLCSKRGVISYITPNTFLSIVNCTKLRKYILSKSSFLFIDCYDESIFDASVNSVVFLITVEEKKNFIPINIHTVNGVKHLKLDTVNIFKSQYSEINVNADSDACKIKEKMIFKSSLLGSIAGVEMCLGFQPYHNTIHTKEQMKSKFLHSSYQVNDKYVRDYGGKHIGKYIMNKKSDNWVDYSAELYTKPDTRFFEGPRMIIREIPSDTLICAYAENFALFNKSVFIIRTNNQDVNLKFLVGVLNSKSIGFYITTFGDKSNQTLFPRISMKILKTIPIPMATNTNKEIVTKLVNRIIDLKLCGTETTDYERILDHFIYHLYDFTYDEVLIIDPQAPITREEYNNFNINAI